MKKSQIKRRLRKPSRVLFGGGVARDWRWANWYVNRGRLVELTGFYGAEGKQCQRELRMVSHRRTF